MAESKIAALLQSHLASIERAINTNTEFQVTTEKNSVLFGIVSSDESEGLMIRVHMGKASLWFGSLSEPSFILLARPDHWTEFFAPALKAPFQSYWGMLRVLGHHEGCQVSGNRHEFTVYARAWRLCLDIARTVINGTPELDLDLFEDNEMELDGLIGRYTQIETSTWGQATIYYESAGRGDQQILLLHTAGADSRQFHTLMTNKALCQCLKMIAFDLPSHGRSSAGSKQVPEGHVTMEEDYVSTIHQVIKNLGLRQPIVCGASMAGQACLAVAIRSRELGVAGVIPCEACDYLPLSSPNSIYDLSGGLDQAVLNAERVSGMIAPRSPSKYRREIWLGYSSQAAKVFAGDLKFYFHGWDGRDRVGLIDTQICPVYMLTGQYDYSCTPAASLATAEKIPGAVFEELSNLGHFPTTENPKLFIPYFLKAINHIQQAHRVRKEFGDGQ
jgi:pimeloyl-ACP methyl ester carboxylesterase